MVDVKWQAVYNDGSVLDQIDSEGNKNSFNDINRSELNKFILLRDDKPAVVVDLSSDKKLIYRRRVAQRLISGAQESVYLAGWHQNVNGRNVQQISFLFEDGSVEVVDKFDDNHPWYYPVKFLPEERVGGDE